MEFMQAPNLKFSICYGIDTYRHSTEQYQSASGYSGVEALAKRSKSLMATSYIPDATGGIQNGNILHSAGPSGGGPAMRGDSVAAIWPSLEVIRDIYSQASVGVSLTWIALWDAACAFRAGSLPASCLQSKRLRV